MVQKSPQKRRPSRRHKLLQNSLFFFLYLAWHVKARGAHRGLDIALADAWEASEPVGISSKYQKAQPKHPGYRHDVIKSWSGQTPIRITQSI